MKLNKNKLNLSIDFIMFIILMAITGIGFLIKFILVPGYKRNEIYGKDVELYFLGIDRHQWGNIHLVLSFTLLFLLLLHLVFHWKQVVLVFRKMITAKQLRVLFTTIFIVISLLFGVAPLFVKPGIYHGTVKQALENTRHKGQGFTKRQKVPYTIEGHQNKTKLLKANLAESNTNPGADGKNHLKNEIEVYGYMTLNNLSEQYKIPSEKLAQSIEVPKERANEKLGRLRKEYSFHLNDLRTFIATGQKKVSSSE